MTDYMELAKDVVKRASAEGAEAEVIITRGEETDIRVSGGEVEQLSQAGSQGMGVRVIDGGRVGYAYTSDFADDSIEQTWRAAVELAQVATPDEHRSLPDPQPIPDEELEIWDKDLEKVSTEEKIAFAKQIEQVALDYDERVIMSQMCTYQDAIDHMYLANSRGFAGEYGRTVAFGFLLGIARDESGEMTNAFGLGASNFFKELDAEAIGREAGENAVRLLGGKPVETQVGTVVLEPLVGAQIIGVIGAALTAQAMQRKRSFLLDKMGQEVGSDMVTLMDNGRLKGGLASAPFDGEGVPTAATRLIDEGVLQNVIYDSYSASRDGVKSTGNAQRNGHRSLPVLGPSNFYMQPGKVSQEDIIAGVEEGLFVTNVMQVGGIDPITGDCSMGASGLWIKDGKLTKPVNNVTIATTLNDFLQNIVQVGSDVRMVPFGGIVGVPTLRVDNVTIGGAKQ